MFLSGVFLGVSSFKQQISIPVRRAYSKIKVYGNATIDKLQIKNIEVDNTTLQNIIPTDTAVWDSNIILLAEFENNLGAGNITGVSSASDILQWQIARTDTSTNVLKILNTQDVSKINYIDYSTQYGKTYQYEIFPLTSNQVAVPLQTGSITNNAFGWFLQGSDADGTIYVYQMDLEVSTGSLDVNEDFTVYDSYTKYSSFAVGKRNYINGTINALIGDITTNNEIIQTSDFLNNLRNRVQDGTTKILKSRKGDVWNVKTHKYSQSLISDGIASQPYLIKFDFLESESI